jgi:hypothetical protein
MSRFTVAVSFLRKASHRVLIVRAAMGCGCRRASHDVASIPRRSHWGERGGAEAGLGPPEKKEWGSTQGVARAYTIHTHHATHTTIYARALCAVKNPLYTTRPTAARTTASFVAARRAHAATDTRGAPIHAFIMRP